MTIVYINTGSTANAGDGDSLRSAFNKVNQNFRYIDGDIAGFGFTGSKGDAGGYTGSAGNPSAPGINGYVGSQGYTGSAGAGYTGSAGAGYTGSAGVGYTGSAGVGYTGSAGVGYTGSASTATGYTGSASTATGYTGSAGTGGTALSDRLTTGSYSVVLGSDGTLTLPNATTISSVDFGSRFFSSSNGPGGVAVQQNSLTVGIANTAFAAAILANPGSYRISFNGGLNDVVIAGISGPASGTNVYTLTGTWPANTTGFPINIAGPDYIAGGVTELASDYGARIATNGGSWAFGANGVLTAPGHIVPNADLAYDLGSTSSQWRSIYVGTGTIYIGGIALGVNENNYVTVDGNPIITINTAGNLTVQGDVNIGTVTISDTAPTATTGTQWFDTVEGRTYIATGGVWLDASPTQIPSPETYLDGLAIDGTVISTANVDGDAIVIDGGDNTKLTVSNNSVTIQVPSSGIIRPYWAAEFGGITTAVTTSSYTIGTGAFYDSVGNVYVLGGVLFGDGGLNDVDSLLLKYDTNGNLLWSRTWHDNSGANCGAVNQAFAIDSNDRIYWLATDAISGGCWTGYMDTDGNLGLGGIAQGSLGFNNAGVSAVDIACDNSGNYYLAGSYYDSNQTPVVIKVDGNSGAPIWTGRIIPEDYEDLPADGQYRAVTVNPANEDVWAIGDYIDNSNLLAMLSKWDINGVHQWTKKLVTSSGDLASAVIYNGGYVYTIVNDDGSQEAIVSKFDTDGDLIWASYLATGALDPIPDGGPGSSSTGAYDLSFDASGNVYVTGTIPVPPAGQPQLWITKLNPANGEMLYSRILITDAGLVVIDQGAVGSSSSGHRVGDIYQDKIAITAVTTSDIDDSTSTNETRVMVAQLPIDGSVTGTFGNITIGDLTSDIDSICSTGTYTVTTLTWSTGTSTAIYSTSSISVSYVTDIVGLTGETLALGSVSGSSTATNTWTFVNNNIILPPGGDILDSNGVSVLGATTSTIALPSWITVVPGTEHLPTLNTDYGWDSSGAWCTNATILENEEGTSFPFRTTFSIPNDTTSVITVDFVVNELDEFDFGIAVFASGNNPVWEWGGDGITISAKYTPTELTGISDDGGMDGWEPPSLGTYRARLTVEPTGPGTADIMLETLDTSNNILDTISYTETEFFGTDYKIGFASDNDGGVNKTYFKNLTIDIGDGATVYTDTLMNGSSVGDSTTALGDRLTAGSSSVVLSSTGTLTLPQGGTISEVTVDDGIRDPSVGILLTPYADPGTNPDMAVKIYPTFNDDDHIHIVAGDPTTVDLFLGDDDQYVKLEQNHGNIVVGTNTTVTNSTWTFGTDGVLTLPNDMTIDASVSFGIVTIGGTSTYISIDNGGAPPALTIATNQGENAWQFGYDGVLTLSTASTILGSGTDPNVYIETATTATTSTWTFDTGGALTLPQGGVIDETPAGETLTLAGAGLAVVNQTYIKTSPTLYTGSDGVTVELIGGAIWYCIQNGDAKYTSATGTGLDTWVNGTGGNDPPTGTINTLPKTVNITVGTETWAFGTDGKLTFPNGANIAIPSGTPRTGATTIRNSTELLIGTNTTTTNNLWTFGIDGSTVFPENTVKGYCFTATNAVGNYIPQSAAFMYTDSPILGLISTIGGSWYIKGPGLVGWKQITAVQDNGGVALIVRIGGGAGPMGDGSEFHSGGYQPNSPDLVYTISQYLDLDLKAADKTWTFSENGSLTFPNATVQTTAYAITGTIPTSSTSTGITGQISSTGTDIYICVATNSWLRVTGSTF